MKDHYRHVRTAELDRLQQWNITEHSERVHFLKTPDDWEIALSSYSLKSEKNHPVLLCHGLGANRLTFDLDRQHSLALYLAEQGYDVYAIDLRGHGLSQKPGLFGKQKWNWGFNDYSQKDLVTAIDAIKALTGKQHIHYVGHSMGGLLLYSRTALQDQNIKSGITLGSSLNYHGTETFFNQLIKLKWLSKVLPSIPVHWPALASSWATAYSVNGVDPVLAHKHNVDITTYRKLTAVGLHPVSGKVLQDMAGAINGEGIKVCAQHCYTDLIDKHGYHFPILALSGTKDYQCSPEASRRFGTEHQTFGKAFGHQEDYGHDDLVMGKNARTEIWPVIKEWLDRHDG